MLSVGASVYLSIIRALDACYLFVDKWYFVGFELLGKGFGNGTLAELGIGGKDNKELGNNTHHGVLGWYAHAIGDGWYLHCDILYFEGVDLEAACVDDIVGTSLKMKASMGVYLAFVGCEKAVVVQHFCCELRVAYISTHEGFALTYYCALW